MRFIIEVALAAGLEQGHVLRRIVITAKQWTMD